MSYRNIWQGLLDQWTTIIQGFNKILGPSKWWQTSLILVLLVFFTGGLSYVGWTFESTSFMRIISVLLLCYYAFGVQLTSNQNFRYYILALAFVPFASTIYSLNEYNQPILDSIKGTLPSLLWLSYFLFHRLKIRQGSFLKAVFYVAIIIALIQIIQQFTYPNVLFGVKEDIENLDPNKELVDNRNGLWRFRFADNGRLAAIVLLFLWCSLWKNKIVNLKFTITFLLMLVSIYLTLTRQIIFAILLTLFFSYFIGKKGIKIWIFAFGIFAVGLLYSYSDILFADFVKQTDSDINNQNYIRILAANYFWNETFSSVSAAFLGHGIPVSGEFLLLHQELIEEYRYFIGDVGFIGMMWRHGIIYVIVCYALLINVFWQKRDVVPLYIRLFALFNIIPSIMMFPMYSYLQRVIWCFLLYYCDLTINYNKTYKIMLWIKLLSLFRLTKRRFSLLRSIR